MRLLAAALLFSTAVSLAPAASIERDVVYGEAGGETLKLDICTPDGAGPFPVVVLVHGGGWGSGDKAGAEKPGSGADITPWFQPLTDAGIAWVSINYRLAPANRWPACVDDTRAALAWVKAHIAEHHGDPTRLALMGHSAGGHIALLAALPEKDGPAPVAAVVGCAAVSDLVSDSKRRGEISKGLQNLFGLAPAITDSSVEILSNASPLNLLRAGYPPILLLHGDADRTVPLDQSRAFQEKARGLGIPCELRVLPGAPHRLTEWAAHDPEWSRALVEWLQARWSQAGVPPKT